MVEPDLLLWSEHLRQILNSGNYEAFCHHKSELNSDDDLQLVWKFLKTIFQSNPKEAQLELLGYSNKTVSYITFFAFFNNRNRVKQYTNVNKSFKMFTFSLTFKYSV